MQFGINIKKDIYDCEGKPYWYIDYVCSPVISTMRKKILYLTFPTFFLIALLTVSCRKNPVSDNSNNSGSGGQDSTAQKQKDPFYSNGKTDNTKLIQAAIDSTSQAGGGVVEFSNGTYVTGPIEMKSNVTLEIKRNATLLATTDMKAYYPAGVDTNGPLPSSLNPLITSDHATNIRISGTGTIDGSGKQWWTLYDNAKSSGSTLPARPRLIKLNYTTNIVIDSVKLKNSPQFHVSLENCWHVKIENVTITAPSNSPNTDGIDPATCHFVTVTNCTIDTGDDNVAVKSGRNDPSDSNAGTTNIHISNNTFLHGHGVSIGSETNGGVDSMYVENNTFNGTTNGFRIKSSRSKGGNIRNIVYKNNTMKNVENPIRFTTYYPSIPPQTDPSQSITSTTPYYHDISIINLESSGSPSAGIIVGLPEKPMTNIILNNVNISAKAGLLVRNATVDTSNTILDVPGNGYGDVNANSETLTGLDAYYEVPSNGTTNSVQKVKPDASTSGSSGTHSWPNEKSMNTNRYVEFSIDPQSNYTLTVDTLSMLIGSKGIQGMDAAIYYSTSLGFSNPVEVTEIDSLTNNGVSELTKKLNIPVSSGQELYLRIYPWLPGGTTSTTKYMYVGNVTMKGVTQSPSTPALASWPLANGTSASFSGYILQKGGVVKGS